MRVVSNIYETKEEIIMFSLIVASMNFGMAVWLIDYSMFGVALNVAFGTLNFGLWIRGSKSL